MTQTRGAALTHKVYGRVEVGTLLAKKPTVGSLRRRTVSWRKPTYGGALEFGNVKSLGLVGPIGSLRHSSGVYHIALSLGLVGPIGSLIRHATVA
jgi:hypothetical protein